MVLVALTGLLLAARRQRSVEVLLGSALGALVLLVAEANGAPVVSQAWIPLLVLAAQCPSWVAVAGLAVAALALPILVWPAAALALAAAFAWLVNRPRFR